MSEAMSSAMVPAIMAAAIKRDEGSCIPALNRLVRLKDWTSGREEMRWRSLTKKGTLVSESRHAGKYMGTNVCLGHMAQLLSRHSGLA